jgi:hypothetical protein
MLSHATCIYGAIWRTKSIVHTEDEFKKNIQK